MLHGFTYASDDEIDDIIREVVPLSVLHAVLHVANKVQASNEFLGPSYNLLTRNCNHFTSHLCKALTGQPAPPYLNRAASIGVSLPCIVPAGWIEPPECDDQGEQARLTTNARRHSVGDGDAWGSSDGEYTDEEERRRRRKGEGMRDEEGRVLPGAERARLDRTVKQ